MGEAQYADVLEQVNNVNSLQGRATETVKSSVNVLSPRHATDTNESVLTSESKPEHNSYNYETQLFSCLILSDTSSVNLCTVPKQITEHLKMRIQGSNFPPNKLLDKVLHIAKLELAFLLSKESVSLWNEYNTLESMKNPQKENTAFLAIQVGKPISCFTSSLSKIIP